MKDFTQHQEALALKELGFREDCFGMYDKKYPTTFIDSKASGVLNKFNDTDMFLAPLYSQAFRWFREKYKYYHCITPVDNSRGFVKGYYYDIMFDGNEKEGIESESFIAYEEAELECLKKLIEIVKDGK